MTATKQQGTFRDPDTGKTVTLSWEEGEPMPTEAELEEVFAALPDVAGDQPLQAGAAGAEGNTGEPTIRNVLSQLGMRTSRSIPELLDMPAKVFNFAMDAVGAPESVGGLPLRQADDTFTGAYDSAVFDGDPGADPSYIQEGWPKELTNAAGTALTFGMGAAPVARSPSLQSLAADVVGLGYTTPAKAAAALPGAQTGVEALQNATTPQVPVTRGRGIIPSVTDNQKIADAKLAQDFIEGNADAAGYKYNAGSRKIERSTAAKRALKTGIDRDTVALAQKQNPTTKRGMREMLDIKRATLQNAELRSRWRPSDVLGQSITNRLNIVRQANHEAGKKIDEIANTTLKQATVDVEPVIKRFATDLRDKLNVKWNAEKQTLDFSKSTIADLPGLEKAIKRVFKQFRGMSDTNPPSAYDVHRLKRIIDNQIAYGKTKSGLTSSVESVLRDLRRELDGVLDNRFPDYDEANSIYSESVEVLSDLQGYAGQKVDIYGERGDRSLGTMARKILSNYQSGTGINNTLDQLDTLAKKYSTRQRGLNIVPYNPENRRVIETVQSLKDDSLIGLITYASELDRYFKGEAANSFLGNIQKAVDPVKNAVAGDSATGILAAGKALLGRSGKIDEEAALDALEALTRE